ncbi:MAG: hypothetical protein Q8P39_02550 [Candidatus Yanofskybacteria bacterium]|nr:hypothetical protein [Candidatus Yanofskybacteria bacterium]
MNMEFLGATLDLIGKVLIAYTAIKVHYRFWKEHRIDQAVFQSMKAEQTIGVIGIIFLLLGFVLEHVFPMF